jgi:GNAT superfamily N-acetyltransferase
LEIAQRLRFQVWEHEGAILSRIEEQKIADKHDDHGIHWGVFHGDEMVGAARLCLHGRVDDAPDAALFCSLSLPTPVASMNRLVVLKKHRGQGLGRRLDELRVREARDQGAKTCIVAPVDDENRVRSLEDQGFIFIGNVRGRAYWSESVSIRACYRSLD